MVSAFLILLFLPQSGEARSPLQFKIDNQTFLYNLEWTGIDSIVDGETFVGNILKTFFEYHFHKRLYVQVGALLQHPFGDDDRITEADPVIALHFRPFRGWQITGGTIDRNHPLHEGLFWDALRYTEPIEQGIQFKGNTKHLRQDLWVSWERRESAAQREKFSVGNYTEVKWRGFSLDGQLYWIHFGGQKFIFQTVSATGTRTSNNISLAFGGGYTWAPERPDLTFFKEPGVRVHYLYQKEEAAGLQDIDESGFTLHGWVNLWGFNLFGRIWSADGSNFNSRRGDIEQPGIALSKGNPLYRAEDFQEIGLYKVWHLADSVSMRLDLRQQFVLDELVEVYGLTFQWVEGFDLFEDYFSKHWKGWSRDNKSKRTKTRLKNSRINRRLRAASKAARNR